MIKNRRGNFQFSFGWIFAIIAGVIIVFLAIYGVTKFMNLEKSSVNAQTATDIGVLTNPLESSFETVKRAMISTPAETRIYTNCSNASNFGRQIVRTSVKSYNQWSEEGINVYFQNKFIFSENPVEGKNFYVFSKPFEFPFKVSDLIYLTSTKDKYCFIDAPRDIEKEIELIRGEPASKNENLFIETSTSPCHSGSINVCFRTRYSYCDIFVYPKYVEKDSGRMYYEGDALMYAAIFSEKDIYECELDRLMKRTGQLYEIYKDKSKFLLEETGCPQEFYGDLMVVESLINSFESSEDLQYIYSLSETMDIQNKYAECKLW